ncbi:hypothetical protein SAMN04488134_101130 [Amphibacillus marinus]|uniref:Multi-TM2 domain-containing protein n=1 Tax=Amphibacillus marinus TaxID=872970 RepID=A0A1H8GQ43_9BACI|nr:hypothetical protein [Amphibacillus marinus]SEN45844.1 hypothetical protein SAMN04488134_101130 [Amphibacillus marinus]
MKSPLLAFFLALFPGGGHLYLGYKLKGLLYPITCIGAFILAVLADSFWYAYEAVYFLLIVALFIWIINVLDIIMTLIIRGNSIRSMSQIEQNEHMIKLNQDAFLKNERVTTILLSLIPGAGQFYLGLAQRGLTIIAAFFGIISMVLFVGMVVTPEFTIFLFALPILWIYSMFDAIQLLNKKQAGEKIKDRTIFDDFKQFREDGKKSKLLATILAIFPGAGHMYLGLQKRGLQLMAGFLLSVYILDVLNLGLFLFIIPIIWFYSFFDALQLANRAEYEQVDDIPIINYFVNHQKWIGIGLIALGLFYLFDAIVLPSLSNYFIRIMGINLYYYYSQYLQMAVVSLLLIGVGIRLLKGSKKAKQGVK